MEDKKQKGGKRAGAGRPRSGRTEMLNFRVSTQFKMWFETLTNQEKVSYIEDNRPRSWIISYGNNEWSFYGTRQQCEDYAKRTANGRDYIINEQLIEQVVKIKKEV